MNKRFTKDPVLILLTKLSFHYEMCRKNGLSFDNNDEYEIVEELIESIKGITKPKRNILKLVRNAEE